MVSLSSLDGSTITDAADGLSYSTTGVQGSPSNTEAEFIAGTADTKKANTRKDGVQVLGENKDDADDEQLLKEQSTDELSFTLFLNFPTELRRKIWKAALPKGRVVELEYVYQWFAPLEPTPPVDTLLRTCKESCDVYLWTSYRRRPSRL